MTIKEEKVTAALAVAEKVYDAFAGAAKVGATEMDLRRAVEEAAQGHEIRCDLITGERTAGVEGDATERVLQQGDPLLLDLCLRYEDHWCDVCRTFFLGEATARQREAYAAVRGCMEHMRGLLRPGIPAGELYAACRVYLGERGYDGCMRHHCGHGVGLTPFEAPVVVDSADVIREGDVVTVEIGIYFDDYGIRVEDDCLVLADGVKTLWDYPKEIEAMILKGEKEA